METVPFGPRRLPVLPSPRIRLLLGSGARYDQLMAKRAANPSRAWLAADTALWQTCKIVTDIAERRLPDIRTPTLFPLRPNEIAFASGPFAIESFHAAGDGSYSSSSTVVAGTGMFGLALGAATMAGSALGNASRRSRAAADAELMWRPLIQGTVVVSNEGFYLLDATQKLDWDWASVDIMQVAGFTSLVIQGRSTTGPITWRLRSDWAELIFVLWAMNRHPQHPQFVDHSWIPQGWPEWAAAQGYPPSMGLQRPLT